jgi:hypothetical protein
MASASEAGGDFLGSAVLADLYGRPLLWPLPGDDDALALATVDLGDVGRSRERDPLVHPGADRRTDV